MAPRARAIAFAAALGWVVVATEAAAAPKQPIAAVSACRDAYYQTQVLRDAGELEQAASAAAECSKPECASFIREDCTTWQAEIDARLPSLTVSAVDASGAPLTEGEVLLDGKPWLHGLGGPARTLARGTHTIEVHVAGAPPASRSIDLREGERDRNVSIAFDIEGPLYRGGPGIGPWIVGGAGVAALVAGAVTGALVVDAYSTMKAECDDSQRCTRAGADAIARGQLLGPATTALLASGGALAGAGALWLVLGRGPSEVGATSAMAPMVGPTMLGVAFAGRF